MCDTSATADELVVVRGALEIAGDVLYGLGLPLCKAMDLSTPRGFDRAVASLASLLRGAASALRRFNPKWENRMAATRPGFPWAHVSLLTRSGRSS